jgi:hypothetical protein
MSLMQDPIMAKDVSIGADQAERASRLLMQRLVYPQIGVKQRALLDLQCRVAVSYINKLTICSTTARVMERQFWIGKKLMTDVSNGQMDA